MKIGKRISLLMAVLVLASGILSSFSMSYAATGDEPPLYIEKTVIVPIPENNNTDVTNSLFNIVDGTAHIEAAYQGYYGVTTGATVTVKIQKKKQQVWLDVNNGQPDNTWTDELEDWKNSVMHSLPLTSPGEYRAVITYTVRGDASEDVIVRQLYGTNNKISSASINGTGVGEAVNNKDNANDGNEEGKTSEDKTSEGKISEGNSSDDEQLGEIKPAKVTVVVVGKSTGFYTDAKLSSHKSVAVEKTFGEIVLPEEGEVITYSTPLVLYSDEGGLKLEAMSAERQGDTVTFYTDETKYYFDPIYMNILTSEGEVFVSLNGIKSEDGTYKYVTRKFEGYGSAETGKKLSESIKSIFGSDFDESKSYYEYSGFYVSYEDYDYISPENIALAAGENKPLHSHLREDNVHEMILPENGQFIFYDAPFILYSDSYGYKLEVISAERDGRTVIFHTNETNYKFNLFVKVYTSKGEVLTGLDAVKNDNGTYDYILEAYKGSDYADMKKYTSEGMAYTLGHELEKDKSYYEISQVFIYPAEKALDEDDAEPEEVVHSNGKNNCLNHKFTLFRGYCLADGMHTYACQNESCTAYMVEECYFTGCDEDYPNEETKPCSKCNLGAVKIHEQ